MFREDNVATMLTRRELGLSAVAALGACAVAPESAPEPDVAEPLPAGPLYFDLHIDTPARLLNEGLDLAQDLEYTHVDIPKMRQGGLNAGFFAVSTSARGQTPLSAVKNALRITDVVIGEVASATPTISCWPRPRPTCCRRSARARSRC